MDTEQIYQAYPRHRNKIHALESIEKAIQRIMDGELGSWMGLVYEEAFSYLLARTKAFAQSPAGQRGRLTPHPATWFNRGGYMDDPDEWQLLDRDEEKELARKREANVGVWRPE
jgi:hypothetical protein